MKLKGKISIFVNEDYTTIEIEDDVANMTFAKIKLTPQQLSAALSRRACVDCEIDTKGLDKVGKQHENKHFEFEIPDYLNRSIYADELQKIAQSKLSDGWIAESYFGSQGSFFVKDGKQYARCVIRRWV